MRISDWSSDVCSSDLNTTKALLRAIIRAQIWLDADNGKNRPEAVKILARPNYVGADENVIANSMTGTFTFPPGDTRPAPDFNIFFRNNAGYPFYSAATWRSEERREGTEGVRTCRYRGSPYIEKKKTPYRKRKTK